MAECKHELFVITDPMDHSDHLICEECEIDLGDPIEYIYYQDKQLHQAQATIAAMRGALKKAYKKGLVVGAYDYDLIIAIQEVLIKDTAGAELLANHQNELKEAYKISEGLSHQVDELNAEIEQLQRENKALIEKIKVLEGK